ncbi:MAG TPA: hypothetical protein VES70_12930, partial [Pseudomonas sp.]|nr:hypothetical protein [Pseudomonas sp.]
GSPQFAMRVPDHFAVKVVGFIDLAMVAIGPSHEAFQQNLHADRRVYQGNSQHVVPSNQVFGRFPLAVSAFNHPLNSLASGLYCRWARDF